VEKNPQEKIKSWREPQPDQKNHKTARSQKTRAVFARLPEHPSF